MHASFLRIVSEMSQSILDPGCYFDDLFEWVHLTLKYLREHLIDIVRVTAIHSDFQRLQIVACLQIERNLLYNLFFVKNEEVTEFAFVVLSKFSKFSEVNAELNLIENVIASNNLRVIRV